MFFISSINLHYTASKNETVDIFYMVGYTIYINYLLFSFIDIKFKIKK